MNPADKVATEATKAATKVEVQPEVGGEEAVNEGGAGEEVLI